MFQFGTPNQAKFDKLFYAKPNVSMTVGGQFHPSGARFFPSSTSRVDIGQGQACRKWRSINASPRVFKARIALVNNNARWKKCIYRMDSPRAVEPVGKISSGSLRFSPWNRNEREDFNFFFFLDSGFCARPRLLTIEDKEI